VSALYGELTIHPRSEAPRRLASAAIFLGTSLFAGAVRAEHTSVHATASGEMATTDNLYAAGSDGDRHADMFATVRPGLLYAYDAPQMVHDFNAELEVVEYLRAFDGKPLIMGRAGWKSMFLPTPRTSLTMSINTATGLLSLLSTRASADQTTAQIAPSGKVDVQQVDASQQLSWIIGKHTRITQGVLARYAFTDDGNGGNSDTREVGGSLGFERNFEHDTVGIDAAFYYLHLDNLQAPSSQVASREDHQLNPRAVVSWRHDFNRQWSSSLDAGGVYVQPFGEDKYQPLIKKHASTYAIAGAQLSWTQLWGRASLIARRDVSPNLFLAQNTVDESANLQVAVPLPWLDETRRNPKLAAAGSIGVEHQQLINSDTGSLEGDFKAGHLDVSVGWTPTPGITYGFRYEFVYQTGDDSAMVAIPSYYRNTVYFTFSLRYPDRVVGELPPPRRSARADGQDLVPVGGEPVVIDVFADPDGGGGTGGGSD
jgi:hypothetical protein